MTDRASQLRALWGFDFPDELFEVWEWSGSLSPEDEKTLGTELGLGFVGPFDVLAGKFGGVKLRYPATLHWRFQFDPAEMVTVFSGDTDGLHFGLWFDDPGRLEPVVAAYYARDAFELWQAGTSLVDALDRWIGRKIDGAQEMVDDDPDYAEDYERQIFAMRRLRATLPKRPTRSRRQPSLKTPEGMGVVGSGPGAERLAEGKRIFARGDRAAAFPILAEAYEQLGRPALARITRDHAAHPKLPYVDMLRFPAGHFADLDAALRAPAEVRHLELVRVGLTELPDMSGFTALESLAAPSNALTTLPDSLGGCTKLRAINLWKNQLRELPEVLTRLPALETLKLGYNPIASLPASIGRCASLNELDLLATGLESLPDEIGQLRSLTGLNLAGNALTRLPESFTELSSLRFVALSKNQLTRLPRNIGRLPLERLAINGNPMPEAELARVRAALPNTNVVA